MSDAADVAVVARAGTLAVLVHEPRPSWAVTFLRRALEGDPLFRVAATARASRGIVVTAGAPPPRLTAAGLARFDAVVIAAPEDLTQAEVAALDAFAGERGGAVVFVPDRRPSGAYTGLLRSGGFDEALVENPVPLQGSRDALRVSEIASPRVPGPEVQALATLTRGSRAEPVVWARPHGAGRIIFSGALDAWRYRDADAGAFNRFWTSVVASAAAAAPPVAELSVDRAVAAPGEPVTIRLSVRATEFVAAGERTSMPPVSARVVHPDGRALPIRLWPAGEAGVFTGQFEAGEPARYALSATAGDVTVDAPLLVAAGVRRMEPGPGVDALARATGGVDVNLADLSPLRQHVETLGRPVGAAPVRPMRSGWWLAAFAGLLSAEWWLRRRGGLR